MPELPEPSDRELQRRLEEMSVEEILKEAAPPPGIPDEPKAQKSGFVFEEVTDEKITLPESAGGLPGDEKVMAVMMQMLEVLREIRDDQKEGLFL